MDKTMALATKNPHQSMKEGTNKIAHRTIAGAGGCLTKRTIPRSATMPPGIIIKGKSQRPNLGRFVISDATVVIINKIGKHHVGARSRQWMTASLIGFIGGGLRTSTSRPYGS
jgi:hypothetical protein